MMNLRLRSKLLILILGFNAVFFLTLLVTDSVFSKRVLLRETQKRALERVRASALAIEGFLQEKAKVAWTIGQDPNLKKWLRENTIRGADHSQDEAYQAIISQFKSVVRNDPEIKSVFVASEKTQEYFDHEERNPGEDYYVGKRPWYIRTVQAKRPVFSVNVDLLDRKIYVTYQFPIYDEDGGLLGVGGVDIRLSTLGTLISESGIFESSVPFLVARDGRILFHPDTSVVLKKNVAELFDRWQDEADFSELWNDILAGKSEIAEAKVGDQRQYLICSPVKAMDALLLLTVPEREINAPISRLSRFFFILFVASLVVLVGMIIFITDSISRPVEMLARTCDKIAKGDYSQPLDLRRGDEIGVLADSFRSMIEMQRSRADALAEIASGNLHVEVRALSENDVLGRAMVMLKERIEAMVSDVNALAEAAVKGQLQLRAEASRHHGDYRKIVEGINDTLKSVITPINEAALVLQRLAEKDLTARMSGEYGGDFLKIKDSLNKAISNLEEGMLQVTIAADQVAAAAVQIGEGSQAVAQGASEQAGSLQEVTSSLQELASMTRQNAANAKDAEKLANGARASTRKGVGSMGRLSEAMNRIKASSDNTVKIVKTIDEIAFQTNLLALNAAVEAARAGEAGKGFGVVAEEVRALAMRSAEAARQTAELIKEAIKNADDGVALNQEVIANFEEINDQVGRVTEVMAEIAEASHQQNQGIAQINEALEQMSQVTQSTAANAEESASAAEELSVQAGEMRKMVSGFKLRKIERFAGAHGADSAKFSFADGSSSQSQVSRVTMFASGQEGEVEQPAPRLNAEKVIPFDPDDGEVLRQF